MPRDELTVKRVSADSVPYGPSIARRGNKVWAVHRREKLLGVYSTAKEVKRVHHIWPAKSLEWKAMDSARYSPHGKPSKRYAELLKQTREEG